jgi:glycosyltransferase involved in cell wall biosynthesis
LALVRLNDAYAKELEVTSVASNAVSLKGAMFALSGISASASRLVDKAKPRLAHLHFLTVAAAMLPFLTRHGIPFIVTAHGYDATVVKFRNPVLRALMRARLGRVFAHAQCILCDSDYLRDCVIERGCPPDKAVRHYIGAPVPAMRSVERDPSRVLFVGRLVPKKGILNLLRAASIVRESGQPIHLRVIGDGPQRAEAEKLASELGLNVDWLGTQPHSRVLQETSEAAVFCLPSSRAPDGDNEGLPIVYLEAQALETPIVAFDQGPVPEAVAHGETGLLAPDHDVAALAENIGALLKDRNLAFRLGQAGRRRVLEHFDIEKQSQRLERIYDSVVART